MSLLLLFPSSSTPISVLDSGVGVDAVSIVVKATIPDSGVGLDTPSIKNTFTITDSGAGSDVASVIQKIIVALNDSGVGTDQVAIQARLAIADLGAGSDIVSFLIRLTVPDSGVGNDAIASLVAKLLQLDTGIGVDAPIVKTFVTLTESGVGVDVVVVYGGAVTKLVTDTGLGNDVASVIARLTITDTGRGDSPYQAVILVDGPIGYWRLSEEVGITAIDVSGNGFDGTYAGVFTLAQPGAIAGDSNKAAHLNQGTVGIPGNVNPWSGDFTIEAWLRPNTTPDWRDAIFIRELFLTNGFRTGYDVNFRPGFWVSQSGGSGPEIFGNPMSLTKWNHVVFVKSGSQVLIYQDGVLVASGNVVYQNPAGGGAWGASQGVPSNAYFDELAIYDRALSPTEILAHYNAGTSLRINSRLTISDAGIGIELVGANQIGPALAARGTFQSVTPAFFESIKQALLESQKQREFKSEPPQDLESEP